MAARPRPTPPQPGRFGHLPAGRWHKEGKYLLRWAACGLSGLLLLCRKLDVTNKTTFVATAAFEAARRIDELPVGHRAHGLHGHGFLASLRCCPPLGSTPFPGGELDSLQAVLAPVAAQLDYRLLNDQVASPTNPNLARWVQSQCAVPGLSAVALQSTTTEGCEVSASGQVTLWRRYAFHSAHYLPNVPAGHKCGNMHGHGFEAILHMGWDDSTDSNRLGYEQLDAAWAPLHAQLDHACLNELVGLENPTSEMLSSWVWQRLQPGLPTLRGVTVYETASCGAHYDGSTYQIWKELTLDSALRFKHAPEGHPRRQLHGHTYTLRLHLSAPLDEIKGWTVDFGDVKEVFNPLFKLLDHKPLYEIPDLTDCDTASIAHWVLAKARSALPQLYRVDLFETRGCGVLVSIGQDGPQLPL